MTKPSAIGAPTPTPNLVRHIAARPLRSGLPHHLIHLAAMSTAPPPSMTPLRLAFIGLVLIGTTTFAPIAWAHEGHDHDDEPAPAAVLREAPRRQGDGSVLMPEAAQRQLGLRTQAAQAGSWPQAFELPAKVVMDPNAGGLVQAALAGRVVAGPKGLPSLGQAVRRGQVLAHIEPTTGALEQAGLRAQQAELRAALQVAERRLARLQALADTVARKDIEAAAAEAEGLRQRLGALSQGLSRRDALVAPVSGVIASARVVAGQVVQPGDTLYEVIDPRRQRIEALVREPGRAGQIGSAQLVLGDTSVPLRQVGAARSLRDQAVPVVFSGEAEALSGLVLGQAVKVVAQSRQALPGIALPRSALVKGAGNQDIAWVRTAPERFEPRWVTHAPLDGTRVRITSGLKAGDQVLVQGANLVNQVR
jgi:biotin carboxyl carrier protein